jgi:hypothetical protein
MVEGSNHAGILCNLHRVLTKAQELEGEFVEMMELKTERGKILENSMFSR